MLGIRRQNRMEKVKEALKEAASYSDERVHDRRLRLNIQAAVAHGTAAATRVRRDVGAARMTSRMAHDKKLRRDLRALLHDLDGALGRLRNKRRHRVRNALLLVSGTGVAVAATPSARRWIGNRTSMSDDGGTPAVAA